MLMEVKKLTCGYSNETNILKNINFSIEKGEFWCILGPNGVGKTTLFKTILGLLKPQNGNIYIGGKEIKRWKAKELAKLIAYVPQTHTPPFPFKVIDVITMGRNPHFSNKITKRDLTIVEQAFDLLDINYLKNAVYTEISGGERQLVLIARAFVQETEILVLDEPAANLDFGNQTKILMHLRNLRKKGKTIIMTSHFPDNAFLPESKVILLGKDGFFLIGNGHEILTEKALKKIYQVNSKIISLESFNLPHKICVPVFEDM